MKSLMDVVKPMDQKAQPSRPANNVTAAPSLADFAKKQQAAGDASGSGFSAEKQKPVTLMDVARQESTAASAQAAAPAATSLQSIAQEINDEESKRIEKALTTTANEVRTEQREHQASVLKEAVDEVRQEETQAALDLVAKIEKSSSQFPVEKPISNQKQHENTATRRDDKEDEDGYSSFGDQEEEERETHEKKQKPMKKKKRLVLDDDEDDSDGEGNNGPERTVASDTPESKAFLRAVYRADLRTIHDMLDGEDVSVTTADQHGWSGLHWAASQGHTTILELLLKKGAPVNAVDHINGWAPLHVAAVRELLPCVKLLLQSGADLRVRDSYGDSSADILRTIRGKKRDAFLQTLARFQSSSSNGSSSA